MSNAPTDTQLRGSNHWRQKGTNNHKFCVCTCSIHVWQKLSEWLANLHKGNMMKNLTWMDIMVRHLVFQTIAELHQATDNLRTLKQNNNKFILQPLIQETTLSDSSKTSIFTINNYHLLIEVVVHKYV